MDKSQRDPGKRQHDLFHAKGVVSFRFMPVHRNNMPVNGVGSGFQRIGQWNNLLLLVLLIGPVIFAPLNPVSTPSEKFKVIACGAAVTCAFAAGY